MHDQLSGNVFESFPFVTVEHWHLFATAHASPMVFVNIELVNLTR